MDRNWVLHPADPVILVSFNKPFVLGHCRIKLLRVVSVANEVEQLGRSLDRSPLGRQAVDERDPDRPHEH